MPGFISNKSIKWDTTPLDKRPKNVGWSEDAIIKVYDTTINDTFDKYIKNSGLSYVNFVAYILYYDNVKKMTYLQDVRDDVLYSLPSGAKAKGYTLAYKLNSIH